MKVDQVYDVTSDQLKNLHSNYISFTTKKRFEEYFKFLYKIFTKMKQNELKSENNLS